MGALLLHVGPHKTGSTAIQAMLAGNAEALAAAGWQAEPLAGFAGGAHGLADLLSMDRTDAARPALDALAERAAGDTDTIVSSENFSRLNTAQVQTLIGALPFDTIRMVYYLRNPLLRLQSAWRERVKHGYRHTLVEFVAGRLLTPFQDSEINDLVRLRPWLDTLGRDRVDVHLYDPIADAGAHFFATYLPGVTAPQAPRHRVNTSPAVERVEVYRALAGYQTHLLRSRDFDPQVEKILDRIAGIQDSQDGAYARTLPLSLDSAILRRIEIELARACGFESDRLFDRRSLRLDYLAPEIWFEHPDLTEDLFALRARIADALGQPVFDERLRKL
ncbi:MAG: hypothetical protein ACWA5A_13045 [Marinibacterium sp.]